MSCALFELPIYNLHGYTKYKRDYSYRRRRSLTFILVPCAYLAFILHKHCELSRRLSNYMDQ